MMRRGDSSSKDLVIQSKNYLIRLTNVFHLIRLEKKKTTDACEKPLEQV